MIQLATLLFKQLHNTNRLSIESKFKGKTMNNALFESENSTKQAILPLHSLRRVIGVFSDFIVIIFLIILYFVYSEFQHRSRMQLINEPRINDFYFVDYNLIEPSSDNWFRYVPLKVSSINGELITFKIGNLAYSEKVAISEHVKFDVAIKSFYFKKEDLEVSYQALSNWFDDGIIYDIARPRNIYINGWIVMNLSDLP